MKTAIYIDEAGRGPFAGPVYVGLVLPLAKFDESGFADSKILSAKQREEQYQIIQNLDKENKIIFSSGSADHKEIDKYGISGAIQISILRGIFELFYKYFENILKHKLQKSSDGYDFIDYIRLQNLFNTQKIDFGYIKDIFDIINKHQKIGGIFVDGKHDFKLNKNLKIKTTPIVDGDAKVTEISMASIVAKVQRDNLMDQFANKYPQYGFEKHKGYGTKLHSDSIIQHGICKIHRLSFLQNMINSGKLITDQKLPKRKEIKEISIKNKIEKIQNPQVLIHTCCAPDLTWPLELLDQFFEMHYFWYNPNITDKQEHQKRLDEYYKLLEINKKNSDIKSEYNPKEYFDFLFTHQNIIGLNEEDNKGFMQKMYEIPEGGSRCELCYLLRLSKTAQICASKGIKYFTTTLSISPHKNLEKIKKYGQLAGEKYGVKFIFFDFRQNDGFKKSLELCQKQGIRRQDYCGCLRSQTIRDI